MQKPKQRKSNATQRARFIKAAREHGVSEDEREFDENLKRIAEVKPHAPGSHRKPK
jgi:hypothetical protein